MTQMLDILVGYTTRLILDAGHVESFVVEQTDDALLGEQKFDYSFTLVLAEIILPIPVRLLNLSLNTQSSLVLVDLGLQLLLVRFSLGHHAIHSLFEQNF
jgi:hypothetical protein